MPRETPDPIRKAIREANDARALAFETGSELDHLIADLAIRRVDTVAWFEDVKERYRARGIVIHEEAPDDG